MNTKNAPTQEKPKRRVVLELYRHEELRTLFEILHRKTGMRSSIDIIRIALKNFNANLPESLSDKPQQ
ncbi:hypothetical protein [Mesorhizobium sp.]|uniref:hypothetical protein n=1 Tax=Mesorhizobium sp. TaxID=1871066 RepID=UPI000FE5DA50|nr:hypothetical protein [Mesorhizobium sp.]RWE44213.1 MAG: hypothetical protein EOS80_19935 [Mesorhizobium sp.]